MRLSLLCFGVVLAPALLLLGSPPDGPSTVQPAIVSRVAAPPDTLRFSTSAGMPLVQSLPATLNDTPVSRYAVLRGPALSGVAGRSFTWIPRSSEPGTYDVLLRADHPNAPADTIVLRIDLQS